MCGIVGIFDPKGRLSQEDLHKKCEKMKRSISYRGPDDSGFWAGDGIAFGHLRLAVIDLSEGGKQPKSSHDGRWVITYNGEIYNYRELRQDLSESGVQFRTESDTEVLIEGISFWGLEKTLKKVNGMFAFALWDKLEKRLWLARDKIGEKPLYYGWLDEVFYFGSEMKCFRASESKNLTINKNSLGQFFNFNYIPGEQSIYEGIRRLLPGSFIGIGQELTSNLSVTPYWDLQSVYRQNRQNRKIMDLPTAKAELRRLLLDAVRIRMESDVPVGAFLSGGIDSSIVVAAMQQVAKSKVKTFTVGFADKKFNEADHAKRVAEHLQTEHLELVVSDQDLLNVVPKLPQIYDEPFADASQIPTYLISQLTRSQVTVSLSGDGGDELFLGYPRYTDWPKVWGRGKKIPLSLRRAISAPLTMFTSDRRMGKLGHILKAEVAQDFYQKMYAHWFQNLVISKENIDISSPAISGQSDVETWQLFDFKYYLPDDILMKVDRASMAVALESRIPLLDPRIIEFAWQLPQDLKLRDGQTKFLLRELLYDFVPREIVDRPKQGFGVPLNDWIRGPLLSWAGDLLSEESLKKSGLLRHEIIAKTWEQHRKGEGQFGGILWDVLMFQAWYQEYH